MRSIAQNKSSANLDIIVIGVSNIVAERDIGASMSARLKLSRYVHSIVHLVIFYHHGTIFVVFH